MRATETPMLAPALRHLTVPHRALCPILYLYQLEPCDFLFLTHMTMHYVNTVVGATFNLEAWCPLDDKHSKSTPLPRIPSRDFTNYALGCDQAE